MAFEMGIISNPSFDFSDLSASSREVVYSYFSDASTEVPTDIGNAILDTYKDLRYATQVEEMDTLPGQAATPFTSSPDDFVARCVPDPLIEAPVQFNSSRPHSVSSRHSAASGITALRVHSVASRRSVGGKTPSGVQKSDSVIDPDSPLSSKRLSSASYLSLRWASPSSPLRYSFSAIDAEETVSMTSTERPRPPTSSGKADLMMQMDGAADDDGPASAQQYPTWLSAKAMTITPVKRPRLPKRNSREDLEMQIDGAADYGGPSNSRQPEDLNQQYERSVTPISIVDSEYEVSHDNRQVFEERRRQEEVVANIWGGFGRPPSQIPSLSVVLAGEEYFDHVPEEGLQLQLRRGRDNDSHFVSEADSPDPAEAPSLPMAPPLSIPSPSRSDAGRTEITEQWPWREELAIQKAQQNSFKMQNIRHNHPLSDFEPRGEYHDQTLSDYEPPPPSPSLVLQPRQGEYPSRVDQMVQNGTPMSPHSSSRHDSSRRGQRSPDPYSQGHGGNPQAITSPSHWDNGPGTGMSELFANFSHRIPMEELSLRRETSILPEESFPRRDSNDSSNGLKYHERLPRMKMSTSNRFLVVSNLLLLCLLR